VFTLRFVAIRNGTGDGHLETGRSRRLNRRSRAVRVGSIWQTHQVRSERLNTRQRIVVVIGLGVGLYFFGGWVTTRGGAGTGWVAYAPLSNTVNTPDLPGPGLHPWVRLIIWLALIVVWVLASVVLLRSPPAAKAEDAIE
jgi:hypothetical protein